MIAVKLFTMCMVVMESDFEEVCQQPIEVYRSLDFDRVIHIKCTDDDFHSIKFHFYNLDFFEYNLYRHGKFKYTIERYLRHDTKDRTGEIEGRKNNALELKFNKHESKPLLLREFSYVLGFIVNIVAVPILLYLIDIRSIINFIVAI